MAERAGGVPTAGNRESRAFTASGAPQLNLLRSLIHVKVRHTIHATSRTSIG